MRKSIGGDGMKVRFWWNTHDMGSDCEDIVEVEDDMTDAELEQMAQDCFWNDKEPEWGWEKV